MVQLENNVDSQIGEESLHGETRLDLARGVPVDVSSEDRSSASPVSPALNNNPTGKTAGGSSECRSCRLCEVDIPPTGKYVQCDRWTSVFHGQTFCLGVNDKELEVLFHNTNNAIVYKC